MSLKRLVSFFNKEKFDYSQEIIDPYNYHQTFYFFSICFRVIDNRSLPKWTIITPIYVTICGSISAFLFVIHMLQSVKKFDVFGITEAGTFFVVMVYKLFILSCTFTDLRFYHKLFEALRVDFEYICTKGSRYRDRFFETYVWIWKASLVCSVFLVFIGGGMIVCANLALAFFLLSQADGNRPLPFPMWTLGFDRGKTPTYEITLVFSINCVISQVATYIFMMQTEIVWIGHIMSKADVIMWSIEDLLVEVLPTKNPQQKLFYDEIIKARMREIIKMHHSMYRLLNAYAGVYMKLLMFEQKMCAPIVCLTAFCSVEKMDDGIFPGIMLLLCISAVIVCFIPCYLCTTLAKKTQAITDACWNIPFWNCSGGVIRPYLLLIMQRSLRPLPIQAPGFESVSLETFSSKLTFAYSCFNMLRQVDYK